MDLSYSRVDFCISSVAEVATPPQSHSSSDSFSTPSALDLSVSSEFIYAPFIFVVVLPREQRAAQ